MSLVLTLINVESLENGESIKLVLDRHGALIGRSPNADWSLPDAKKHISFTHCEITYRAGDYVLVDHSTNGTFLNGASERVANPYVLRSGDELTIGHYRVRAQLSGADAAAPSPPVKSASDWDWNAPTDPKPTSGWDAPVTPPSVPAPAPSLSGWDSPPATPSPAPSPPPAPAAWDVPAPSQAAASGWDAPPPQASPWGELPMPKAPDWPQKTPAAAISGRGTGSDNWTPPPVAAPPQDVWSRFAAVNEIDWAGAAAPAAKPWGGETPAPTPVAAPVAAPAAAPAPAAMPPQSVAAPESDECWNALLQAAGLSAPDIKASPKQAGATAGALLRRMVGGLVVMLEARARAKAELGATATIIEVNGNNPLKFLRQPETAVAKLLSAPERGFMDADRAIDDAFKDLQAHQMASLAAMQGALRETLTRFAPAAIKARAETGGLMAAILPAARDAALWRAYEREFEGVVKGSDEAFMDFFAKAFREAYQKASAEMRRT